MGEHLGFIVVTLNPVSGMPELDFPDLHYSAGDARNGRDAKREETARLGRRERHVVAEVIELDEDTP